MRLLAELQLPNEVTGFIVVFFLGWMLRIERCVAARIPRLERGIRRIESRLGCLSEEDEPAPARSQPINHPRPTL